MKSFRERHFRGARIEDAIVAFTLNQKEISKLVKEYEGEEKRLLLAKSAVYQEVINRLVSDFKYRQE